MYKLLNFEVPKKLRSTDEHNKMYVADCDVPGVYVPNMSDEDNERWKCKHVKGKEERIEIRRWMGGANVVILAFKDGEVTMSANSKMYLCKQEFDELCEIVKEAREYMNASECV